MTLLLSAYRGATRFVPLIAKRHLRKRIGRGKEDPIRWTEKLGQPSTPRPDGKVIWLNAVGLGEVLSLRGLIAEMAGETDATFLVTSTTRASAQVLARNMPERTIHQFLPLDAPSYRRAFLDHWQPDLCIWAEQDLWPGFVLGLERRGIPQVMVAARMTPERFAKNKPWARTFAKLYNKMAFITAQDDATAERLTTLGAMDVQITGSLKPASPPLEDNTDLFTALKTAVAERFVWIAAPTHPEDEAIALTAHTALLETTPNALLIIAPRSPDRAVATGLAAATRSKGEIPGSGHSVFIADTFGELGTLYRLAQAALIGGTFGDTEGHSPWEAAALNTAILYGPRTANFAPDFVALAKGGGAVAVSGAEDVVRALNGNLTDIATRAATVRSSEGARTTALAQKLIALV